MSATRTCSAPGVAATPSVIIFRQNGQPVATVAAPVARASAARCRLTRWSGRSSNHARPPPDPQQKVCSRLHGIAFPFRQPLAGRPDRTILDGCFQRTTNGIAPCRMLYSFCRRVIVPRCRGTGPPDERVPYSGNSVRFLE
jgi:hypothetical protein